MRVGRFKALHLITTLPRLSGAADNTRYTVNLLDQRRYEVHLAFGAADPDTSSVAPHVRLIPLESLVRPVAPIRDTRAMWDLYRLIRHERYDIVHTHNSKAGVVGRLVARLAGVPVIVHTAHTISFAASTSRLVNWLYRITERAIAPLTTKIITVSTLNTRAYVDAGIGTPDKYTTIYSGVETDRFLARPDRVACRAELGLAVSEQFVLWIGRLNRQKDPLTFVKGCRLLADQFPSARFALVGEDSVGESLEPEVRALIRDLELSPVVRLLGYRADIPRLLAAADLVLHTSVFEGLGRSVVEAMLSGVPLVAAAVDGVQEAVDSGERGGLLVPAQDPAALASAAARLLTDSALADRLAGAGREWAAQRFEVGDMVRAIDQLYQSLSGDQMRRSHD
jgi:glycosyltransferase involved in cell wall biosynthesis